ncbi:MAG: CcdB family protein [Deltaproteobacteria bacterium]|nr:CcdB family protein [Deltaproteobacteria bacterium]
MAQFDLYKNPRGGLFPLLLDVQTDLLSSLETRVVVPLATLKKYRAKPITRLNPTVTIDDVEYVLVFQELAAIPRAALGKPRGSLASLRTDLVAAVDLVFTGL